MTYAEKAAKVIFTRYPNPKAGPEYLVELVNCLADQPQWIIDRLADRHLGITAKHKSFVPSIGEVLDMVGALREMEDRAQRYEKAQSRRQPVQERALRPFRPFPRLWEAFADEPAVLEQIERPDTFDFLANASRVLATRGKDAARKAIIGELSTDEQVSVVSREAAA